MFYKVVDAILLFVGKENANERKESLLLICRVQLFFCKDTTFPRNFQGFGEKCRDGDNAKIGGSRYVREPPSNLFLFLHFLNFLQWKFCGRCHLRFRKTHGQKAASCG